MEQFIDIKKLHNATHMYAVKIIKYLYTKYYRSVLTISWKCPLWRTKCTLVFWQVWVRVRSSRLNLTFEWERTLMTEQIEHVIKTRLNHLFISCHEKKENMMKRRDAMPNAFEDHFSLSFNIKALMTSKTQSAVNPLLIYYCKSLFCCCSEHTSTSCTICCVYDNTFFLSLTWHGHYTYSFIKHCYCWIRTTSWTELMFAWQIICQHHPISTINLQTVYGREYWGHIACLCFKTAAGTFRHSIKCVWWKNCLKCLQIVYLLCPDSSLNAFKWVLAKCNER